MDMKRLLIAANVALIALLLSACRPGFPPAPRPTELALLDTGGGPHSGVLAGGCLIEMDAPVIHSGHFTPFESGDPFVFEIPDGVEGLTLELRPFDEDTGQPGDPIRSEPVFGAPSQISLSLNADPGWYILVVTLDLPDDDCAVYWFPVGVTA